jgi:filamentous hemagglutinin
VPDPFARVIRQLESADGVRYLREVDVGRPIGFDRFADTNTSILTVMSDRFGNLVTAFPGVLQ